MQVEHWELGEAWTSLEQHGTTSWSYQQLGSRFFLFIFFGVTAEKSSYSFQYEVSPRRPGLVLDIYIYLYMCIYNIIFYFLGPE
jgi:hypothetical protein